VNPNYNGIEVDMLNLSNADSMLVTRWTNGVASRVLIDGGNRGDAEKILNFLVVRGATDLDHIVCSHPHDDHAAGLPDIIASKDITFGQIWMHLPWKHVDLTALAAAVQRGEITAHRVVKIILASLQSSQEIVKAANARNKVINEPFQGKTIGFLTVCGPSQSYYEELLKEFTDFETLTQMDESLAADEINDQLEESLANTAFGKSLLEQTEAAGELGKDPTQPENNSTTLLGTVFGTDKLLFTADAGVPALEKAVAAYDLTNVRWMQIPHHGSRRNITKELISLFRPKTAYVSADGTRKHPRRAVVNAFKAVNTKVFSTHYPNPGNLWFHLGATPERPEYWSATALYDAEKKGAAITGAL
jgi:beta-lactamase superfamily II metal-dependent hydrolase